MKIHSLYFYPVKSCTGVQVDRLPLEEAGPKWDRQWMIVDENGKFVTQRELPALCLLQPEIRGETLILQKDGSEFTVSEINQKLCAVEIWGNSAPAIDLGSEVADWLIKHLGRPLRLVRLDKEIPSKSGPVRFVDSHPLHLCSLESLADLNTRLATPVEILRFRPNIVIEGGAAFAEDNWKEIQIGSWKFPIDKACTRCSITTVDPSTGEKGVEPLKTLAKYRLREKKVEFGQYLRSNAGAELRVGMGILGF